MTGAYLAKASKLVRIVGNGRFRRTLTKHRVAATTEHLAAIRQCEPATLLDIGANKGQFSTAVLGLFPSASIHAFEPLPQAADTYEAVFADDGRVQLHRVALGAERASLPFFVTNRTDSSSLLRPGSGQAEAFGVHPSAEIVVPVVPLDEEVDLRELAHPILMKIDVQGTELDVLRGCTHLEEVDFIYIELSFVELYENQALFEDVDAYLQSRGFTVGGKFHEVSTARFGPTQADFLYVHSRRESR